MIIHETFRYLSPLFVLAILAGPGCGPLVDAIKGDNKLTSEPRSVGSFTKIRVLDAIALTLHTGSETAVSVRSPKSELSHIQTEVAGDTLILRANGHEVVGGRKSVEVTTPSIAELIGRDESQIVGAVGTTSNLRLEVGGNAKMDLDGAVESLQLQAGGNSTADLGGLLAQEATVALDGNSDVNAAIGRTVSGTVSGNGELKVHKNSEAVTSTVKAEGNGRVKME